MKREELLRSKQWWLIHIQNRLYNVINEYKINHAKKNKDIAQKLNVSKGYVSQILAGDYDHKLSKMVELALAFGKAPKIEFVDLESYIREDAMNLTSINVTIPANQMSSLKEQETLKETHLIQTGRNTIVSTVTDFTSLTNN